MCKRLCRRIYTSCHNNNVYVFVLFCLEVISSSDSQQVDDLANKEVEELPSGDLRRRLGKKSTPSQSDSTANEETSPTDVTTETERIVVRYVTTMCSIINV